MPRFMVSSRMKLSQVIATLIQAQKDFGDVPVQITDPETGYNDNVQTICKVHPYTTPNYCMDRSKPVNAIRISVSSEWPDLVLAQSN